MVKKWKIWRSDVKGLKQRNGVGSEGSDCSSMNNDTYTAVLAAVVRAPPNDFKAVRDFKVVREEWAAIRIQTTFRGFFVFPSDFLFFSFILGNLEERHFNSLLVLILISSKLIRRCYKPWQIFLLCPFLCYIINAITLYWSFEQMDMTKKDEDDAIVGAVATSVLAFGVAIIEPIKIKVAFLENLIGIKIKKGNFT